MTTTRETPPGATLHLGGTAYAAPALEPLLVPLTDAKPYPGNPRRHDQDAITASVREHGLYQGLVLQRTSGHVLVGNGRRQAVEDLGGERVPVTWLDVDDVRAAAIVAVDNRVSDLSWNDTTDLLNLLAPLADDAEVLALAGYSAGDLEDLQRMAANLAFVDAANADQGDGVPLPDVSPPIDTEGDTERVTVTVNAGTKGRLYALLQGQDFVLDVADAHTRKPAQ